MSAEPAPIHSMTVEAAPGTGVMRLKWLATAMALVSVAEAVAIVWLASAGDPRFPIGLEPITIGYLGSVVLYPIVGALIVQRRPTTRVAWLMIASGVGLGLGLVAFGYGATGTPPAPERPLALAALLASQVLFIPSILSGTVLLLLLFPTDRLLGPRWRLAGVMALAGSALYVCGVLFRRGPVDPFSFPEIPNPLGVPESLAWVAELSVVTGNVLAAGSILLAAVSVVIRYRRADPVEAAQIRWIALVAALVAPGYVVAALQIDPISEVAFAISLVLLGCFPIAIGIAITRYHLFDIDRLINRTLVYGSLTAILAGVFTAGIVFARWLFMTVTGETSDVAIVLTTLVVATLYAPLRKRLEAMVDRRFKYEEHRFGAYRSELRGVLSLVEPASAAERLAAEAVRELRATGGAVIDTDGEAIATAGEWPVPAEVRLPIPHGPGGLRAVVVGPRHDGEPHDPRSIAELEDITSLVARALQDPNEPMTQR